ncbi:hypothetical protein SPBRAN_1732 [uncultured Candidatus Thioglobus sp.]|nr:hypothetical protein SPBRAN_1732 [uncultured Candidatus Thioglobus sp.]
MEMLDNLGHLGVVLQLAIAPMILISGVGYVLSSLTDRYGRIVGVSRTFAGNIRDEKDSNRRVQLKAELKILLTRTKLVRASITFSVLSLLFISVLVLSLFFMALLNVDFLNLSITLFVGSLVFFTISLVFFILDVNLSLKALTLETESLK